MKNWLHLFQQPYPLLPLRQSLVQITVISLFVMSFLLVFQPFGLFDLGARSTHLITGIGLLSLFVLLLNVLSRAVRWHNHWPVYAQIVWLLRNLITIGLAASLYVAWEQGQRWDVQTWLLFQRFTLAIGLIPITTSVILRYNYLLRRNLHEAYQLTNRLNHSVTKSAQLEIILALSSESGRESLRVPLARLLYIESAGNYAVVHWNDGDQLQQTTLRNTLANISEQIGEQPTVFACHRAYIVNLANVQNIKGNSHGYTLSFPFASASVPVARSKVAELKQRLSDQSYLLTGHSSDDWLCIPNDGRLSPEFELGRQGHYVCAVGMIGIPSVF